MADNRPPLAEPEPPFQTWRRLVDKGLKARPFSSLRSRTRDGIIIEPLYPPRPDANPLPSLGARAWAIVQIMDDGHPERANEQAAADLQGGATGLSLRFAGSPLAPSIGLPATAESLSMALDGVDLARVAIRLDPHPLAATLADWLAGLTARRAIAPELTDIAFGLDPVAAELSGCTAMDNASALTHAFASLRSAGFRGPIVELDARPFHETGASEAQELAAVLSSAAWWLRAFDGIGIAPEAALAFMGASLSVDHDQFVSIAKTRALRLLWARLAELCETPSPRLRIHAETSRRMMAAAAPHTNLVRITIAAFAAGVGGADSIAVMPYSAPLGPPDAAARALARNTQHLLMDESHVHKITDPAAGSGLVEALTDGLAEHAWAEFQQVEREGGILESLRSGDFPARIATAREALQRGVAEGAIPLVGATIFRTPDEPAPARLPTGGAIAGLAPVRLEDLAAL
jgi:methylmalonyl-CoA mutase